MTVHILSTVWLAETYDIKTVEKIVLLNIVSCEYL